MKLFKTLLLSTLIIGTSYSLNSCQKIKEGIEFGFNIKGTFPVPPQLPANVPYNLPTIPISHNISQEFADNGTNKDHIKDIKIESLKLTVEEPVGEDMSFLKDIEISLEKDGVGTKVVAWKYDVPDAVGQTLDLEVTSDALDDYLKSDNFEMNVKVTTDEVTSKEYKIAYNIRTKVRATLFE